MPKTLAELIALETPKVFDYSDCKVSSYEVYPEDDGYDLPTNPYAPV